MTKNILQLNLIKNIQNRKENSSTFWFTRMSNRGYKQFYLNRHGINFIQSYIPTSLKKLYSIVKLLPAFFATNSVFELSCKVLQKQFTTRDYDRSSMGAEIEILDRKELLTLKTI